MLVICRGIIGAEGLKKALGTPEGRAMADSMPRPFREGLEAFLAREYTEEGEGISLSFGLMQALWMLAEKEGCGLLLSREAMRPSQYVIECCERLGLDPYRLPGKGRLVLKEEAQEGDHILGRTGAEPVRRIKERDGFRYLVPPERGY